MPSTLQLSSCDPYWFDGENVFCRFIFCDVVLNNVCLMCYFSMFCRTLPRSMILNSGSTLRSRRRTRGTWSCARSGKRSGWRGWRRDARRRQQKRREKKKWKEGMLWSVGRIGSGRLSVLAVLIRFGGQSRCIEEGKVALLHAVVSRICLMYGLIM